MSMAKQAHSARTALTKAIENKVQRMDMLGLIKLATTLKVPVPAAAKTIHARQRKSEGRTSTREGKVLQGDRDRADCLSIGREEAPRCDHC